MEIIEDDLTGEKIQALLAEHLTHMHEVTPPGSAHALDLAALRAPEITFWTAWHGDELLTCGALKELGPSSGEVKSMRTPQAHRGRGFAAKMLDHIVAQARSRGYTSLKLETGSMEEFAPARALYLRSGFRFCGPFGDYVADPNNVFMEKTLQEV